MGDIKMMEDMKRTEETEEMEKITDEAMLEQVVGGTDYSYAQGIMSKMLAEYDKLVKSGVPADKAKEQVKKKYWGSLISVCKKYPEQGLTPEEQAQIIFMFILG